jgi:hypothetical protein
LRLRGPSPVADLGESGSRYDRPMVLLQALDLSFLMIRSERSFELEACP